MTKRFFGLILTIAMLCALLPCAASAATSGTCGDNVTWVLEDGTLTISGTGDMYGFYYGVPWNDNANDITEVIISDGITSIGDYAFSNCTSLASVSIPDSVNYIGDYAFSYCSSITGISIPDNVNYIGGYAFFNCTSLADVSIPDGVTSLGNCAFAYCESLTSISIPDGVTAIGEGTFASCTSLTSVSIPDGVTSIGNTAFCYCESLTSVSIPDGVTSIGYEAFYCCTSLTSFSIPDSVSSIDYEAFSCCTSLTSISVPDNVTTIDDYTFYGCLSLTEITLGSGITSIGNKVFGRCDSLSDVYYLGTEEQWASISIGSGNSSLTEANIHFATSGTCGDNLTWTLKGGTLTISGTGAMEDFPSAYAMPWCGIAGMGVPDVNCVIIDEGVTSIGACAFMYHNYITKVEIPESVTKIGAEAFYECLSLPDITIPSGVESIGNAAFSLCDGLDINVEEGNQYYSSIDGVLFDKDKTEIIVYTKGEESYTIPDGVTSIKAQAFCQCDNLREITIPAGAVSIGSEAFYSCDNLVRISLPDSITSIGEMAFAECTALTDVYYAGTEEDWNLITFDYGNSSLTDATIHYNSSMPTPAIVGVTATVADSVVEITVETENILTSCYIFAAGYKSDGSISGISEVTEGKAELPQDTQTVKVFIWDGKDGLTPMCESARIDLT